MSAFVFVFVFVFDSTCVCAVPHTLSCSLSRSLSLGGISKLRLSLATSRPSKSRMKYLPYIDTSIQFREKSKDLRFRLCT